MMYLNAALFCGIVCLIGEIILDNTTLTSGHITSMFVVVGAILSFLGIYDNFMEFANIGASIPITSFGNQLYKACLEGYYNKGILGMFSNMFTTTSLGISSSIVFAFFISLFLEPKD